jgi:hypothetical protein
MKKKNKEDEREWKGECVMVSKFELLRTSQWGNIYECDGDVGQTGSPGAVRETWLTRSM